MDTNYSIKKLTTMIRPTLISFVVVMEGFIIAMILLPLFDMIKTMRDK